MDHWTRSHSRIIDQRGERLPPAWVPRVIAPSFAPAAHGPGVFATEASRVAARRICERIDGAQSMVVASSFLLADEPLERSLLGAARRGVPVYLLLATETRLAQEPKEEEFDQRVVAEHKQMLGKLAGWALVRSAPGFHAKAVLVDPLSGGSGFLLTANLTKEALGRNEELVVELGPEECMATFDALRWAAWEGAEHELQEPGRLRGVKPLGRSERPAPKGGIVATLGEPGSLVTEAQRLIDAARTEIVVSSYGWDLTHPVVKRLCERAGEGIHLTVLARVRPASMPALLALRKAGAVVLGFQWLHAKALLADGKEGLVMSANLERHGLDDGFELGVTLRDRRVSTLGQVLKAWAGAASWALEASPTLGQVLGKARLFRDGTLQDFEVVGQSKLDLGTVVASSADRLEAEPPAVPRNGGLPHPSHELASTWTVSAPVLAPGAKEVLQPAKEKGGAREPYDPPAFKEPAGRRVVAVRTPADLPRASEVAAVVKAAAIVARGGS